MSQSPTQEFASDKYASLEVRLFFRHHEAITRELNLINFAFRLLVVSVSCVGILASAVEGIKLYLLMILGWSLVAFWIRLENFAAERQKRLEQLLLLHCDEIPESSLYAKMTYSEQWSINQKLKNTYIEPVFWGSFITIISILGYF